jgi:hypothetical protein
LHAKGLCFASASYTDKAGVVQHAEEIRGYKTTVSRSFRHTVTDDSITLQIQYSGF